MKASWHLLTGEYPPTPGGVSDYTRRLAAGLAAAGATVHVWAPRTKAPAARDEGVEVHALSGGFGARGLIELTAGLARFSPPRRLLVQYVPQAFGYRGMNVPFCLWLAERPRPDDEVWVMFHEVAFPWGLGRPLAHNVLGAVTRGMARILRLRADRLLVSTPSWLPMLGNAGATWLPIPSNLPESVPAEEIARVRAELSPSGTLIGHFGTYGALVAELLRPIASRLLRVDPARKLLLLGRNGERFAATLDVPGAQVVAPGALSDVEVATRLAACDLLVQPFPDGVTTRRTSVMAGLALGVPTVTNAGALTEPRWRSEGAVALASSPSPYEIAQVAEALLQDDARRRTLGTAAGDVYQRELAVERTVEKLLQLAESRP